MSRKGKAVPCILVGNTSYGYIGQPVQCDSIREAVEAGNMWFAWRIFSPEGKLLRRGYGK